MNKFQIRLKTGNFAFIIETCYALSDLRRYSYITLARIYAFKDFLH